MKIGTKANEKYTSAPSRQPRTEVVSSFAEVTRWNTSCCGIEPIAIVTHAALNQSHSFSPALGKKSNLPASAAAVITLPVPPAMSLTSQATAVRPSTIAALIQIPVSSESAPPESTEKTRPSAVSCAAVQPRYEMQMATLVATS